MFEITLSPVYAPQAQPLSVVVAGSALVLNGVPFDFAPLGEGDTLPRGAAPEPIQGEVNRKGGVVHITLTFPYPDGASEVARFPEPIRVAADGPVALPELPAVQEAVELPPPVVPQEPGAAQESEVQGLPGLGVFEQAGSEA